MTVGKGGRIIHFVHKKHYIILHIIRNGGCSWNRHIHPDCMNIWVHESGITDFISWMRSFIEREYTATEENVVIGTLLERRATTMSAIHYY